MRPKIYFKNGRSLCVKLAVIILQLESTEMGKKLVELKKKKRNTVLDQMRVYHGKRSLTLMFIEKIF